MKPKYPSMKPLSPTANPFREPMDEKSRRLKLQENILFRDKFRLEPDMELIYSLPRQRMYGLMHFMCTCASVTVLVLAVTFFYRDMLDVETFSAKINPEIPEWVLYGAALTVSSMFVAGQYPVSSVSMVTYSPVFFRCSAVSDLSHADASILFSDSSFVRVILSSIDQRSSPQKDSISRQPISYDSAETRQYRSAGTVD